MLEKAIMIAVQSHMGQVDKAGKPYILHPLRVMNSGKTEKEMICGVLHDVIEDTPVTLESLRQEGFSEDIIHILDLLTRDESMTYDEYIDRVSTDKEAIAIKLYDLTDNMNRDRIPNPTITDAKRHLKYEKAYATLIHILNTF